MARQIEFDRQRVLNGAMECFWQRGYSATSMKHLELATQLTPGSLYNSFNSKEGLFLAALDHYIDNIIGSRVAHYLSPDSECYQNKPLEGIESFIESAFEPGPAPLCLGCLMVNSSIELGPHEDSVKKRSDLAMKSVLKGIYQALQRAQQAGALQPTIDCRQRAQSLALMFNGMLVHWRGTQDRRWLKTAMLSIKELLH